LEEHVEWVLDVVWVQLLVEVDDVVVFLFAGLGGGIVGDDRDRNFRDQRKVVNEEIVREEIIRNFLDVVDQYVFIERVVFIDLVVELQVWSIFEVVITHVQGLRAG